jgi:hypothetical protein
VANNLAAFNSEAWSSRMVEKLNQVNVMLPLVNRNWEGDLRLNKTVKVRTPGSIAMSSYTRGTVVSYQDLVPVLESFTVADGSYFAFNVDDIDKAQSDIRAMDVYIKRAVVAMNNAVETKLLAAYTNTPVGNRITGASAAAITLDSTTSATTGIYQLICQARTLQGVANVPNTPGARWMVIDPATSALLFQDTAHFIRSSDLGDSVIQTGYFGDEEVARKAAECPGFIGRILNYNVYETPHVPTAGGAKFLLFGDNEAISYASQIVELEVLRLQTTFADACRGLLLHDTFVPAESANRLVYIKATA